MITFYITTEQRRRAQTRAAELDIDRSEPPGRFPYVWDNRLNSVKRWYDYGSAEDKVGTVYFGAVRESEGDSLEVIECTTEITHRRVEPERWLEVGTVTEPEENRELVRRFFCELLETYRAAPRGPS